MVKGDIALLSYWPGGSTRHVFVLASAFGTPILTEGDVINSQHGTVRKSDGGFL